MLLPQHTAISCGLFQRPIVCCKTKLEFWPWLDPNQLIRHQSTFELYYTNLSTTNYPKGKRNSPRLQSNTNSFQIHSAPITGRVKFVVNTFPLFRWTTHHCSDICVRCASHPTISPSQSVIHWPNLFSILCELYLECWEELGWWLEQWQLELRLWYGDRNEWSSKAGF